MYGIEIIHIPRDEASIKKYIERYKAFRLLTLQVAPESFGTTYASEAALSDQIWYDRLANPLARTWMAFQGDVMVGSITVVGPKQYHPDFVRNPWSPPTEDLDPNPNPTYAHFSINWVFTNPSVRGRGVAKTLMTTALKWEIQKAADLGKELVSTLGVDEDNIVAVSLYRKFGFVQTHAAPRPGDDTMGLLMRYFPGEEAAGLLK
ncbi:hypothetical protein HYALB_00013906 [Hymenoscyphus albidus]|uniref:N-acetyltransferase domain-containing protein n=1 Tax=Hymenoscyphus albidus TaxID=595503 RepID=A0A9N9LVV1_9HELO|nr:hypothetical protein HYALB_00013906 [Hymenoscyphus albidus]